MKKNFTIAVFFISTVCSAQDNFFEIIAMRGNVMLDSVPVTCGQKIDRTGKLLLIGKQSYASVLTSQGYAFQLGRGKHKVKSIVSQTHSNVTMLKDSGGFGAVHRAYPDPIDVLSMDDTEYSFLAGDTLTLIWQRQTRINTYSIILTDAFEKILVDTTVSDNTVALPVQNIVKEKVLLFQIKADKLSSPLMIVKASKNYQNFRLDASCSSGISFIERELLLAGLCEIYNLYYDQIHHLHNLFRYSQKTGVPIAHPYYKRMFKEHRMEKFLSTE